MNATCSDCDNSITPPLSSDEPTTALDVVVQKEVIEQVIRLRKELDCGVVYHP